MTVWPSKAKVAGVATPPPALEPVSTGLAQAVQNEVATQVEARWQAKVAQEKFKGVYQSIDTGFHVAGYGFRDHPTTLLPYIERLLPIVKEHYPAMFHSDADALLRDILKELTHS